MAIGNPGGAQGYTTLDDIVEGTGRVVLRYEASAAISDGDVVVFDTQTTDDKPTVDKAASGDDPRAVCGVAIGGAAAGDIVKVCRLGPCKVNISTNTVVAWELAQRDGTTAGAAASVTGSATVEVGDYFGIFLGAEIGSTNQAVVDVRAL